jgi:hypothetical protein
MLKYALLFLLLIVASVPGLAQSTGTAVSKSPVPAHRKAASEAPKQNLSDDFAKAGLKALRGIERTLGQPSLEGGSIAVPRQTQELIDNADAEAQTDEEKAVVAALNSFYLGRLMNNLERQIMKPASYNEESEARAQVSLDNNPRNIEMNSREGVCSHVLDDILRSRHYPGKPVVCYEVNPPKDTTAKQK